MQSSFAPVNTSGLNADLVSEDFKQEKYSLPGLETVCDAWQPSVTRETCILASLLVLGKISNKKATWKPLDCFDW